MSAIEAVHEAYDRLNAALPDSDRLSALRKARAEHSSCQILDESELLSSVTDFGPREGWLRYQSELVAVEAGNWTPTGAKAGRLLYGELVNAGGESMAIRPLGSGWRVVIIVEGKGGEYLAEKASFLRDTPGMRGVRSAGHGNLRYTVYWTVDGEGSRPVFARFIGFGRG